MSIYFFSRDERTHKLFRSSWHIASLQCGADASVVCRGFGWRNALLALRKFIGASHSRRVIFGTSEVCLYAMFSNNRDIWVFTGLGRLLIDEGLIAQAIRTFLRRMYRGQRLVVLNDEDGVVIQSAIGGRPIVIDGEGYEFLALDDRTDNSSQQLTFAYVGRLLKSKGVLQLVNCFVRNSESHWSLLLIGDSDFANRDSVPAEELSQLAQVSKGKIVCTGFRSDVRTLLRDVDVLISLSLREGLPFSILDGVAAGAHLVLSPVPGHLSFKGLPGVTFIEPHKLASFFEQISENSASFLNFDRDTRLVICKQRFGQETIIASIKEVLMEPIESF